MPIFSAVESFFAPKNYFEINNIDKFMETFLPIAANNIFYNYKTIEIYEQFSKLIDENSDKLSSLLDINMHNMHLGDNFYLSLYKLFQAKIKKERYNPLIIDNRHDAFEIYISNNSFTWYISSLSYAVLAIKNSINDDDKFLIDLTSMILIASGHILVLCVSENYSINDPSKTIFYSPLFDEYHIFLPSDSMYSIDILKSMTNKYFYIYVSTSNDLSEIENLKIRKETPYIQIFHISSTFEYIFKEKPFSLCIEEFPQLDKFNVNRIEVTLYNSQFFISDDLTNRWICHFIEKYAKVFIRATDFIEWNGGRIGCYSELSEKSPSSYIDFNEMHYLKIDHHVSNPLYLTGIKMSTINLIDDILENIKKDVKTIDSFKTKNKNTEKNIEEKLLLAFHNNWKYCCQVAYPNQIYVVHDAINYIQKYKNSSNHKGCVYQVKTGEGKSLIIRALAHIFGRMKKTVHIVSSNIVLSCRDYEISYDFFRRCDLKSSILIRKSEFDKVECKRKCYYYPYFNEDDLYHESAFDKKSGMNTKVMSKSKFSRTSDIIFSTFFNFEGWYLRKSEEEPLTMKNYFEDAYLIIDESDTILIDELTNGTIIARNMKSKSSEILEKVYDMYQDLSTKKYDQESINKYILKNIMKDYPECNDITSDDIDSMINDIKYANMFEEGSKYIIEKSEEDNIERIVPFDSEQKGIIENEKEFSGYIHQFIGIKEKKAHPNRNIEIRPLSLNYLYISHPIFVNLYQCVWGFTGTVGTKKEIEILKKYYKLDTLKVPSHSANYRRNLASVICPNVEKRNKKIIQEVKYFHTIGHPVLVILENVIELRKLETLMKNEIKNGTIKLFDGMKMDKSEIENKSGLEGMITLGTNFCGRGTNIDYKEQKPLHVIIAYGPRNVRSLKQAYGRTGRDGKSGTTRIICTKEDYYKIAKKPNQALINNTLKQFDLKKQRLSNFIESYRTNRPWIFNPNEENLNKIRFDNEDKTKLYTEFININRLTAVQYNFPICMEVETFLKIQIQKIYSLKNCPECKYTWILFQRYLREMILESWSIFINKFSRNYEIEKRKKKIKKTDEYVFYESFFESSYRKFETKLSQYLPNYTSYSITETFMQLHQYVVYRWSPIIMKLFPGDFYDIRKENDPNAFLCFKVGFYPFEIKDKSGARIFCLDGKYDQNNSRKLNFIEDPELQYLRNKQKFSITYYIDKIFEKMCETIDKYLSNLLGLHFYIRRGFAGCEFGICIDPLFEDIVVPEANCLFDKTPILLFSIRCKSTKPFLAAILIIVLVFATLVSARISKYLLSPALSIKDILLKLGKMLWKQVKNKASNTMIALIDSSPIVQKSLNTVIEWLKEHIYALLDNTNDKIAIVMRAIVDFFAKIDQNSKIDGIKISEKAKELFSKASPLSDMLKIGILFVLLLAAFIKNFKAKKALKTTAGSYQNEFQKNEKSCKNVDLENYKTYNDVSRDFDRQSYNHYIMDIDDSIT